jgi:hypothetical protein
LFPHGPELLPLLGDQPPWETTTKPDREEDLFHTEPAALLRSNLDSAVLVTVGEVDVLDLIVGQFLDLLDCQVVGLSAQTGEEFGDVGGVTCSGWPPTAKGSSSASVTFFHNCS